jgi:hypothetical protein
LKRLNRPYVSVRTIAISPNAAVTVLSVSEACCQFEAQFDANSSLLHTSHFNMAVRSQNVTQMTSQKAHKTHKLLTGEGRLPDWFINDTARSTYWRKALLPAGLSQHSNFRDFWVASRLTQRVV